MAMIDKDGAQQLKEKAGNALTSIYEKGPKGNPSGLSVGIKTAKAYLNYCSTGQNQAGQKMIAMPGSVTLGQELGAIYSSVSPSGSLTAMKMANAFDLCLMTFVSTFQNSIITGPFKGLLKTYLDIYLNKPSPTASKFAANLAMALHLATTAPAIQVIGVIPGTPPVPFAGPIV